MSTKTRTRNRPHRSIYQVHYALEKRIEDNEMAKPLQFLAPEKLDIQQYKLQVAGHQKCENAEYLGVLQCNNGTVLKPILKEGQRREIDFYEHIATSENTDLMEMKKYIPSYYGCKKFTYHGFEHDYIIMEDLTERMLEPCIMDVKIGRRTWDPLASAEKIKTEKSKYVECRRDVAFCIPGFQVYKLSTGKVHKYTKDYGKKLDGQSVREALKIFLNGVGRHLCRALILQFLTELWKIQKLFSKQTAVKLYSSSLLLIYGAQKLRECCGDNENMDYKKSSKCTEPQRLRRKSIHTMHSYEESGSNFSGRLSCKGPVYSKIKSAPITPISLAQSTFSPLATSSDSPWHSALVNLNRNHSFIHNYEDNISKMKRSYRAILDQLSSDETPKPWATVKIIDFAHAFFTEDEGTLDVNFGEGIDHFVQIFEEFLHATDDQVF